MTGATAGVAAGATVFGFSGPHHSTPEALRAAGAQVIFQRMEDLPALLAPTADAAADPASTRSALPSAAAPTASAAQTGTGR